MDTPEYMEFDGKSITTIPWDEIKTRAKAFAETNRRLQGRENSESQHFWNEFFHVFGKQPKHLLQFSITLKLDEKPRFADMLWPSYLLAEHKSKNKSLKGEAATNRALAQCLQYAHCIEKYGDKRDVPKFIALCDFTRIHLYNYKQVVIELELDQSKNQDKWREPNPDEGMSAYPSPVWRPVTCTTLLINNLHDHVTDFRFMLTDARRTHLAAMKATLARLRLPNGKNK